MIKQALYINAKFMIGASLQRDGRVPSSTPDAPSKSVIADGTLYRRILRVLPASNSLQASRAALSDLSRRSQVRGQLAEVAWSSQKQLGHHERGLHEASRASGLVGLADSPPPQHTAGLGLRSASIPEPDATSAQ